MRDYVIMTDSCCDMLPEMVEELNVCVLPLHLLMGEQTYDNLLDGSSIDFKEFYTRLKAGENASTSAVNVGQFTDAMRNILSQGKDILYLAFSSALSTTYQSACIAAEDMKEEFPDGRISIVDTFNASQGQGLFVYLCAQKKAAGMSLDEVTAWITEQRNHICAWFTVDDLEHLKRGGRISAATALVGGMLSIKPVLHIDNSGNLINVAKARGRKAAINAVLNAMEKHGTNLAEQTIFISHGDCLEEAEFMASEIRSRFGVKDIYINYVGPVIGSHTGTGIIGVFFIGSER